jgi:hypothetical protein
MLVGRRSFVDTRKLLVSSGPGETSWELVVSSPSAKRSSSRLLARRSARRVPGAAHRPTSEGTLYEANPALRFIVQRGAHASGSLRRAFEAVAHGGPCCPQFIDGYLMCGQRIGDRSLPSAY